MRRQAITETTSHCGPHRSSDEEYFERRLDEIVLPTQRYPSYLQPPCRVTFERQGADLQHSKLMSTKVNK